jgi:hypothetical protein
MKTVQKGRGKGRGNGEESWGWGRGGGFEAVSFLENEVELRADPVSQLSRTLLGLTESLHPPHLHLKFIHTVIKSSVADPGCLSQIADPDFYPSRIPGLGPQIQKQQQKRRGKIFCCLTFFVATNITKLKLILFFKW